MNALFPPPADTSTIKLRRRMRRNVRRVAVSHFIASDRLPLWWGVAVRYVWHEWQRCGTKRNCAVAAIADAASLCNCGTANMPLDICAYPRSSHWICLG